MKEKTLYKIEMAIMIIVTDIEDSAFENCFAIENIESINIMEMYYHSSKKDWLRFVLSKYHNKQHP
mgnify:CR=1 FL=1